MARELPEWIGKTDDDKVPDRIKLRVFFRFDGRCQCGCNRKIATGEPWRLDHKHALILGGEHRESNFQPILVEHDRSKVRGEVKEKARTYRKRKANFGIKKPRTITSWRRFDGTPVYASRDR